MAIFPRVGYHYGDEFEIGLDLVLDALERAADRPVTQLIPGGADPAD